MHTSNCFTKLGWTLANAKQEGQSFATRRTQWTNTQKHSCTTALNNSSAALTSNKQASSSSPYDNNPRQIIIAMKETMLADLHRICRKRRSEWARKGIRISGMESKYCSKKEQDRCEQARATTEGGRRTAKILHRVQERKELHRIEATHKIGVNDIRNKNNRRMQFTSA